MRCPSIMTDWCIVMLVAMAAIASSHADQTAGRIFDLSSLFNLNRPNYNNYRPPYYGNGYNPSIYTTGGSGMYPGTGYNPYYPGNGQGGVFPGATNPGAIYPGTYNTGYGTNTLGGNGGYGGFGGNGGLPTYYGYNGNNYYGNRNLGYGYYRNTNTNGLDSADG